MPVRITMAPTVIREFRGAQTQRNWNRLTPTYGLTRVGNRIAGAFKKRPEVAAVGLADIHGLPYTNSYAKDVDLVMKIEERLQCFGYIDFFNNYLPDTLARRLAGVGIEKVWFEGPVTRAEIKRTLRHLLRQTPAQLQDEFGESLEVQKPHFDIPDVGRTVEELKRIVPELREFLPGDIISDRERIKIKQDLETLSPEALLLIIFCKKQLGLQGQDARLSKFAAEALLEKDNLSRPNISLVLENVFDLNIFTQGFSRLQEGLSQEEADRLFQLIQKYCENWFGLDFYRSGHHLNSMKPLMEGLHQLANHPATSKDTLRKIIFSNFHIYYSDFEKEEAERLAEQARLDACNRIYDKYLTGEEILEFFDKEKSWRVPAAFQERLFEHPRMPDDFARQALFESYTPDYREKYLRTSGVGAYRRLREKGLITQEELQNLVRTDSREVLVLLAADPDLPRADRVNLIQRFALSNLRGYCEPDTAKRLLLAGLSVLGDTLSEGEIFGIYPTKIHAVDSGLVAQPNFDRTFRLLSLFREIPETQRKLQKGEPFQVLENFRELVLASLRAAASVFDSNDYRVLLGVLRLYQTTEPIYHEILLAEGSRPSAQELAAVIIRQIEPSERENVEGQAPLAARVIDSWAKLKCSGTCRPCSGCAGFDRGDVIGHYIPADIAQMSAIIYHPKFASMAGDVLGAIRQRDGELADAIITARGVESLFKLVSE